jgi:hypothetical protein
MLNIKEGEIAGRVTCKALFPRSIHKYVSVTSTFFEESTLQFTCRNPNLGLATKARAYKRTKQEGGLRGTSYTLGSARECERMNPHTPKATPTWGVGIPKNSQIFKERLQGSKPIGLKSSLYHGKAIQT